jgi:hypothetical protein
MQFIPHRMQNDRFQGRKPHQRSVVAGVGKVWDFSAHEHQMENAQSAPSINSNPN